jgi:hypothetical protein
MKTKIILYLSLLLTPCLGGCDGDRDWPDLTDAPVVLTVSERTGYLYYDTEQRLWRIDYAFPGTIDSAHEYYIAGNGFTKNLDRKMDRTQVTFSGSCYAPDFHIIIPVGYEYFYIVLTDLKFN